MTSSAHQGELTVEVDRIACEGHALCLSYAPDVFDMDDEERAVVLVDPVPASLHGDVAEAANQCPVQAIRLSRRGGQEPGADG